ncbi:uncharacterized protein B0P05DRAFT_529515 [Gilbertella persicaria]|uniref:uncharacterized protein n=1 Tax=Gilbertella persicaria TaxID=101096 RepID=UPI00222016CC|nr:uncharacterized protein B0P05DRAFT_529515 [Gilbertella persicaria]KAI8090134.1 hypothetical protein B0P05DRAFT_529515 [Gilbertella persicaria]
MKFFSLVPILFWITLCYAKCDCDLKDDACISKCGKIMYYLVTNYSKLHTSVKEVNSCVNLCKGAPKCYISCIDKKW